MPRREIYQRNKAKFRRAESARRRAKWPRVSLEELERLRLPENRLEALAYGSNKKQLVCLNCGGIFERNFSRHPIACSMKPQHSDAYKEQWGYNKSNPLTSADWHAGKSETLKNSEKFQGAKKRNRSVWIAVTTAQRGAVSAARSSGQPVRRGPMRQEAKLRRHGRGLTRRLRRPEVTDEQIEKILALDLPVAESARRAGLSQTAFYRRAQRRHGWTAKEAKAKRALITKYIFELRPWLRSLGQIPTVQEVVQRHMSGLRSGAGEIFQEFRPFLSHLEAELNDKPGLIRELVSRSDSAAVITLASRIFKRSRARKAGAPKKAKPEYSVFGESVSALLPRFHKAFDLLAKAKRENPSSSQYWTAQLRGAGFTDGEISATVASRKAETAAIRRMCEKEGKTFKTGKNDYSLFLRNQPKQFTQ
jgi:hypothetical protein